MLVKKFEANTIKEAIQLVKHELGPDAIILSAKENNNGFMGGSSVEVTAAVSENRMKSKAIVEKRLDAKTLERFKNISAKKQREVIHKALNPKTHSQNFVEDEFSPPPKREAPQPMPKTNGITAMKYVDIDQNADNDYTESTNPPVDSVRMSSYNAASTSVGRAPNNPASNQRVNLAQMASVASKPQTSVNVDGRQIEVSESQRVQNLQKEIQYLKSLLEGFKTVPQNFISMHPGAEEGIPYELSAAYKKLTDAGLRQDYVTQILKIANEVLPAEHKKKNAFVDGWVIKYLLDNVSIAENPMKEKVHIFIGATGQGKTSSIVKMACHLLMKEKKKVALMTCDTVKVGATDQFKIYAQILNMPSGVITQNSQWASVNELLTKVDYVLIDTPGLTLKHQADVDRLKNIWPTPLKNFRTHFVQSALSRDQDAFEVAERFYSNFGFDDVVFTRLDEAVQHGIIYNFQKRFVKPLHSFGIGPAMPDDFEFASKERVVDLIFNLSKFRK